MILTLTGCRAFSYWDGMTYNQTRRYICKELKEKYGKEFTVLKSGGIATGGIWAYCAPKSDESLVFEINAYAYGKHSRDFQDAYIQSIVKQEMKGNIDTALSKYYSNYVVQVYVSSLLNVYDSGIRSASEASTKSYTELAPKNLSEISIVLCEDEAENFDNMEVIISGFTPELYKTNALINCYRVPKDVLDECKENTNEIHLDHSVEYIVSGRYPAHYFHYTGEDDSLWLTQTNLCSCSYCTHENQAAL